MFLLFRFVNGTWLYQFAVNYIFCSEITLDYEPILWHGLVVDAEITINEYVNVYIYCDAVCSQYPLTLIISYMFCLSLGQLEIVFIFTPKYSFILW